MKRCFSYCVVRGNQQKSGNGGGVGARSQNINENKHSHMISVVISHSLCLLIPCHGHEGTFRNAKRMWTAGRTCNYVKPIKNSQKEMQHS